MGCVVEENSLLKKLAAGRTKGGMSLNSEI
jgi:hypothetical protein